MSITTLDLDRAIRQHEAGDWQSAQTTYRAILETEPNNAQVLHLFGMSRYAQGELDDAANLLERAIALDPAKPFFYTNLAAILHAQKNFEGAEKCCRRAMEIDRENYDVWNNLGGVLLEMGRVDEAKAALRKALELHPDASVTSFNLGNLFVAQKEWNDAVETIGRGLETDPQHYEGHFHLGVALLALNRPAEAVPHFEFCVAQKPLDPFAQYNLGMALIKTKRFEPAVVALETCISQKADYADALCLLGVAYLKFRRRTEAERCFLHALKHKPDLALCYNGLSLVEQSRGNIAKGMELSRKAIELDPDCAAAHFNLACQLLVGGDFENGWKEYRWIRRCAGISPERFLKGTWAREPLEGKTIVMCAEQGFGDTIQFVRYAPLLKERGAEKVIVECQRPLERLLRSARGVDRVLVQGERLPDGAVIVPMLDIPILFDSRPQDFPSTVPYLSPRGKLPKKIVKPIEESQGRRIGLAWQGNPEHPDDDTRSMPWEFLKALRIVSGATFFSFQKGPGAESVARLAQEIPLVDLGSLVNDFNESALAMQKMDIVIAVDTSAIHLAGALGRPAWLLVPFVPEWRWMQKRSDSPWYPSMRIFRQEAIGDWAGVMQKVLKALR